MTLRFIVFTLFLFTVVAGSASGYAAYIKRHKDTGEIELKDKPDAPAETPQSIKDYANVFYKNCVKQQHPILKGENLDLFCGCTSAEISKVMTFEQIQAMGKDTKEGQFQRNRMLLFVYTPCISYPTRALVLQQCLENKALMRDPAGTCGCVGDKMGDYIRVEAPRTIERALRTNKKDTDPLRTLLESKLFDVKTKEYMAKCVAKYELGQ